VKEEPMRFICLGYMEEKKWDAVPQSERDAMMEECFAYDDVLRKNGHWIGGEALQSVRAAKTLRWKGGKVLVTDGPFAETKEQLGGLGLLEATDMNHAIELMSSTRVFAWAAPSRFARPTQRSTLSSRRQHATERR